MIQLHEAIFVDRTPTVGALLGTPGSAAIVQAINEQTGSVRFGQQSTRFADATAHFHAKVVAPLRRGAEQVKNVAITAFNPDVIRPLVTVDDFKTVPPCMYEAIVQYAPIRRLLEQGRVSAWGIDPEHLNADDMWGRLVNNGYVDDVAALDKDGYITYTTVHESTDPIWTHDDLRAIRTTRETIDDLLRDTDLDPTNIECMRS